ncbi:MAG: hypothetical protein KAW41_02535 [Candidatus Diapherotrites archaeon]|nr:hypothetical protein [Candidatus Diapherotrites archaeon]
MVHRSACGGGVLRSTAYKVSVADLLGGEFKASQGEYDPAFVRVGLKEINRCNVVGTIVTESPMVLDDGTGEIKVLSFDGLSAKEGEAVRVVGKVREKDGERFISAEIIRPVGPEWLELRRLELAPKSEITEIEV